MQTKTEGRDNSLSTNCLQCWHSLSSQCHFRQLNVESGHPSFTDRAITALYRSMWPTRAEKMMTGISRRVSCRHETWKCQLAHYSSCCLMLHADSNKRLRIVMKEKQLSSWLVPITSITRYSILMWTIMNASENECVLRTLAKMKTHMLWCGWKSGGNEKNRN